MYRKLTIACLCILLIPSLAMDPAFSATVQPASESGQKAAVDDTVKAAPRAVFPELNYTFEPVLEGKKIAHDFIVENQGNASLVIKNIRPD